jgi:hypothetical protein
MSDFEQSLPNETDRPLTENTYEHRTKLQRWLSIRRGRLILADRVVKLSVGEYNVHYIGVNWPHHVFVNQDSKVVGAE